MVNRSRSRAAVWPFALTAPPRGGGRSLAAALIRRALRNDVVAPNDASPMRPPTKSHQQPALVPTIIDPDRFPSPILSRWFFFFGQQLVVGSPLCSQVVLRSYVPAKQDRDELSTEVRRGLLKAAQL